MLKKIYVYLLVIVAISFMGCLFFLQTIRKDARSSYRYLVNSDCGVKLVSFRLEWLVNKEPQEHENIFESDDLELCNELEETLETMQVLEKRNWSTVFVAAIGFITLTFSDGTKYIIDITDIGFFPHQKRMLKEKLTSEDLTQFIEDLIDKSGRKGELVL